MCRWYNRRGRAWPCVGTVCGVGILTLTMSGLQHGAGQVVNRRYVVGQAVPSPLVGAVSSGDGRRYQAVRQ
jgi:hypothetical protein